MVAGAGPRARGSDGRRYASHRGRANRGGGAAWFAPRATAVISAFTLVTGMAQPILPFAAASILLMPILLYYVLREE